ncbi:hypothetical protein K7957_14495 [Sphingomonas yunnanensis]|nr:hypothetical protein [Sphingomonas yunnanensis]
MWHYGIKGESYTSDHYVYAKGGATVELTRYYADGKVQYASETRADGSTVTDIFDTKGNKLSETVKAADGTRVTSNFSYDAGGHLTARTDVAANGTQTYSAYDAASGALKSKTITNADKSGDMWHYGIKGESYTSDHYVYAKGGATVELTRYYADGKVQYASETRADGSTVTDIFDTKGNKLSEAVKAVDGTRVTSNFSYDAGGHLTARTDVAANRTQTYSAYDAASGALKSKTITNADKSGDMWHYGIKGESYTSDHYVYAKGGATVELTRYYADGKVQYASETRADGSTVTDIFDTKGNKLSEAVKAADGTRVTSNFSYDAGGHLTARTDVAANGAQTYSAYDAASGALKSKTITNADKSGDMWHYGIKGESYTSDHYVYAKGGATVELTRYYADGKVQYASETRADGSTVTDIFDTKGNKLSEAVKAVDGTRVTSNFSYDAGGHLTARTDVAANRTQTYSAYDAASGALKSKTITNADKSGDMWHYGIKGESYTSDHYVYAKGGGLTALTRFHADGTTEYNAAYHADGSKLVETYDQAGNKTLAVLTGADGSRAYHGFVELDDQAMLSKSLYNFTSASGGKLAIVGSPSVNLVDDAGHVLGAVDSSAYTIKNGVLTLDANAAGGLLHVGEHARVDVTYAVTNGTTVAPTSVYTIEIDGSLLRADGTAASETVSVAGLSGNYHVSGLGGDDRLFGGEGNDRLFGGGGNDVIVGGGGNDWLYGGAGNNALTGGGGADRFVITAGSNDTITDFRFADGDKIDLSGIDAIATNAAGTLDHFSFVAGGKFTGRAGQLIVAEDVAAADGAHWIVQGDTNGDGHADFALHVTSLDGHLLTAGDFLFG